MSLVLVSRSFVEKYLPGGSPIGRNLFLNRRFDTSPLEIVGVVRTTSSRSEFLFWRVKRAS
jgi:hypothetical protein